ncbi:hypothetical protein D3C77_722420 [compost metagenome]
MIGILGRYAHADVKQSDQAARAYIAFNQFPFHQPHCPAIDHRLHHVAGLSEGDATAVVEIIDAGRGHPHRPVRPDDAAGLAVHVAQRAAKQVAGGLQRRAGPE